MSITARTTSSTEVVTARGEARRVIRGLAAAGIATGLAVVGASSAQAAEVATAAATSDAGASWIDPTTGAQPTTMVDYMTSVVRAVDAYWVPVFTGAGYAEPMVQLSFPAQGEVVPWSCSQSGTTEQYTFAYCPGDDRIVFSQEAAVRLWEGTMKVNQDAPSGLPAGDFAVAFFLAHEYAHSLQSELGILAPNADGTPRYKTIATELHADCWAGVWARSASSAGTLEAGDVEEALRALADTGDYAYQSADHHGTPQQRQAAFTSGHQSGAPASCDSVLTANYQIPW